MSLNLPEVDNPYVDLSGIKAISENPYDALLEACGSDAVSKLQRYCQFMHVPIRSYLFASIPLSGPTTIFSSSPIDRYSVGLVPEALKCLTITASLQG